jgi:CheY-like chemotaxis protein
VNVVNLLLVEDNAGDIRLTREAFKGSSLPIQLSVVEDGEQALAFLRHQRNYVNAPRPDLILLDLNLPRKPGHEVLAEIKTDDNLKRIPVVILTTSDDDRDILTSYNLRANCYITKPVDFRRFITLVKSIENFWFNVVRLPS